MGDVAVGVEEVLEEEDGVAEFDPGLEAVEGEGGLRPGGRRYEFLGDESGGFGVGGWCRVRLRVGELMLIQSG